MDPARQQLHQEVLDGLATTNVLLDQYHQAYPWLNGVDWSGVQPAQTPAYEQMSPEQLQGEVNRQTQEYYERTAPRYQSVVNPQAPPGWIQGETIEPIPLGALEDPVSQAAFFLAPGLLRGGKAVVETLETGGPSALGRTFRAAERGNLGPVPRSQAG